jgi:hypothetical protein
MFVDPQMVSAGGNYSRLAGEHAQEGANVISQGPLVPDMFGEFAAAGVFHQAVTYVRSRRVANLLASQEVLADVTSNASRVAAGFTDMDDRHLAEMRSVRDTSATQSFRA